MACRRISLMAVSGYPGDRDYDQHVHQHGRRHRSQTEYLARRAVFQDNLRFVEVCNTSRHKCSLACSIQTSCTVPQSSSTPMRHT